MITTNHILHRPMHSFTFKSNNRIQSNYTRATKAREQSSKRRAVVFMHRRNYNCSQSQRSWASCDQMQARLVSRESSNYFLPHKTAMYYGQHSLKIDPVLPTLMIDVPTTHICTFITRILHPLHASVQLSQRHCSYISSPQGRRTI